MCKTLILYKENALIYSLTGYNCQENTVLETFHHPNTVPSSLWKAHRAVN